METQKMFLIIGFLFLGFTLKHLPLNKDLKTSIPPLLNKIIIYFCLPALVLKIMPTMELKIDHWKFPLSHWFILLCLVFLTLLTSKLFKLERKTTGCLLILIPLGNTSFLGYPMVEVFFKESSLPYAILYDQLGSFLGLAFYAPLIVALYSGGERPSLGSFLKNIFQFPPLMALLASLFFKDALLTSSIQTVLDPLSKGIIPLAMVAVGLQFQIPTKNQGLPLILGLCFKMVLSPLIALLFFLMLGGINHPEKVVIFQSAMPPMITAAILAADKELQKNLAINLMGVGLILAFILLPICFHLLNL